MVISQLVCCYYRAMNIQNSSLKLLLVFGGRSCEHAVSVSSARSLIAGIKDTDIQLRLVGISECGQWRWQGDANIEHLIQDGKVNVMAGEPVLPDLNASGKLFNLEQRAHIEFDFDAIFPLLHGTFGEDGTIQGLFEMFDAPYVGCGVLASACGMDKLFSKSLFQKAGIPQADYIEVRNHSWQHNTAKTLNEIEQKLRFPLFVKPANMGSSVGISKVKDKASLERGICHALQFDPKVMVENGFENVLEVECAVLGNDSPEASVVGEIRAGAEFYDYDAKYINDTSEVIIPAPISDKAAKKVQEFAITAFKAIDGSGLARVDFFVNAQTDEVWINEINTLPGFTPISMYPKLWQASGLPYGQLIAKLTHLAIERYKGRKSIQCSYTS